MKAYVIKSNHGNHTGFNRKWEFIDKCSTISEAKKVLLEQAFKCSDNIIERNKAAYDISSQEFLCTSKTNHFKYDGKHFMIITRSDVNNMIFNGGSMGYQPNFINF